MKVSELNTAELLTLRDTVTNLQKQIKKLEKRISDIIQPVIRGYDIKEVEKLIYLVPDGIERLWIYQRIAELNKQDNKP